MASSVFGKKFQTFKVSFLYKALTTCESQRGKSWLIYKILILDEMPEWPLLPQMLVIVLLIIALQAAGYWFYLQPKLQRLENLKQQEQTQKSHVADQSQ